MAHILILRLYCVRDYVFKTFIKHIRTQILIIQWLIVNSVYFKCMAFLPMNMLVLWETLGKHKYF